MHVSMYNQILIQINEKLVSSLAKIFQHLNTRIDVFNLLGYNLR